MIDFLRRLPNYIRSFGWLSGLRLLRAVERDLPKKSSVTRTLKVPGYQAPIHLRDSISDHAIFFQCMVKDQYRFDRFPQGMELWTTYRNQVSQGLHPLIIDCGGNIGLSAVWFATQMPQARIVVVEPDADNLAVLKQNVQPFGSRVTVVHGGVWDRPARLRIINPDSGSAAFRVEELPVDANGELRAFSIDELCTLGGGGDPLIVKIDIEGAQAQLFSAHTEWTHRTLLIALELDDWLMPWKGTSRPFFTTLAGQPFDYLMSGETIFCFRDPSVTECNVSS